ncbi:MAG: hypothetical protein NT031_04180 [Planctomycetota bacterium]|nr:hypothetical protein [Planctomycetota bacterium]
MPSRTNVATSTRPGRAMVALATAGQSRVLPICPMRRLGQKMAGPIAPSIAGMSVRAATNAQASARAMTGPLVWNTPWVAKVSMNSPTVFVPAEARIAGKVASRASAAACGPGMLASSNSRYRLTSMSE